MAEHPTGFAGRCPSHAPTHSPGDSRPSAAHGPSICSRQPGPARAAPMAALTRPPQPPLPPFTATSPQAPGATTPFAEGSIRRPSKPGAARGSSPHGPQPPRRWPSQQGQARTIFSCRTGTVGHRSSAGAPPQQPARQRSSSVEAGAPAGFVQPETAQLLESRDPSFNGRGSPRQPVGTVPPVIHTATTQLPKRRSLGVNFAAEATAFTVIAFRSTRTSQPPELLSPLPPSLPPQ